MCSFASCSSAAYLEVGGVLTSTAALQGGVALKLVGAAGVLVAELGHLPVVEGSLQHGGGLDTTKAVVVKVQLQNCTALSSPTRLCLHVHKLQQHSR